jgi:hypothetical protein
MSFTLFPIVDVALAWEADGGLLLIDMGKVKCPLYNLIS